MGSKWRQSEGSPIATRRHEESPSSSKFRPHDRDLTATRRPIFLLFSEENWSVIFESDGVGDAWKNTTIAARSSRDRGSFRVESIPRPSIGSSEASGIRSTLDHGQSWPIARRSWPILKRLSNRNSSRISPDLKPQCRSVQIAPTTPQPMLTTRSITHDFKPNFPL